MGEEFVVYKTIDGRKTVVDTVSSILWAVEVIEVNVASDRLNGIDAEYSVARKEMSPLEK